LSLTDKQATILAPRHGTSHKSIRWRLCHQLRLNACRRSGMDNSSTAAGKLKYSRFGTIFALAVLRNGTLRSHPKLP
jgi:hypothetical protein